MPDLAQEALCSYSDNGTANNISNPVMVGNCGWDVFSFLFAGTNALGQFRLYPVPTAWAGQLNSRTSERIATALVNDPNARLPTQVVNDKGR